MNIFNIGSAKIKKMEEKESKKKELLQQLNELRNILAKYNNIPAKTETLPIKTDDEVRSFINQQGENSQISTIKKINGKYVAYTFNDPTICDFAVKFFKSMYEQKQKMNFDPAVTEDDNNLTSIKEILDRVAFTETPTLNNYFVGGTNSPQAPLSTYMTPAYWKSYSKIVGSELFRDIDTMRDKLIQLIDNLNDKNNPTIMNSINKQR